jgi:hypothetical protein
MFLIRNPIIIVCNTESHAEHYLCWYVDNIVDKLIDKLWYIIRFRFYRF